MKTIEEVLITRIEKYAQHYQYLKSYLQDMQEEAEEAYPDLREFRNRFVKHIIDHCFSELQRVPEENREERLDDMFYLIYAAGQHAAYSDVRDELYEFENV